MSRFWKVFAVWFAALLLFFSLANLAGVVRPMGLKPFRFTGFPYTFAAWGTGVEEFFDWPLLALNCLIACGSAVIVAGTLATLRYRSPAAGPTSTPNQALQWTAAQSRGRH